MNTGNKLFISLIWLSLILVQSACGKAGESGISSATPSPTRVGNYKVGDAVQIQDRVTISLNSVEFFTDGFQADFTIENKGSEKFFATSGSITMIDQVHPPQGIGGNVCGSALVGYVMPGQALKGNVCWSDITAYVTSYPVQVDYSYYFDTDNPAHVEVIWEITK